MSFHSTSHNREHTDAKPPSSPGKSQPKRDDDQRILDRDKHNLNYSQGSLYNPASIGTVAAPRFDHDFSQVKLHADGAQQTLPSRRAPLTIQRFPKNEDEVFGTNEPTVKQAEPVSGAAPTPTEAEPTAEEPAPEETIAPRLIVEDSTEALAPGQMRKTEFLAQLQTEVTQAAEAALAGTGRTTAECPYLEYWFGYYSRQDSLHIERAIRKYAPETASVTTARGYIPIIAERVRQAVKTWARAGEITGVPEGVPISVPGDVPTESGEGAANSTSPVMFKSREGGARAADDPQAIQRELGDGQPLESGVRSRMESAFGMSFAHVRRHTDITAAGLSDRLNARAFTVGKHVAFGSGEYQPGTIVGDALIAHEMAHIVQQRGGGASVAPMQTGGANYNMLENDADLSAIGVVAYLWAKTKGTLIDLTKKAVPRFTSGLRLQACKSERQKEIERLAKLQYGLLEKKRKEKEEKERKKAVEAQKKAGIKNPIPPKIEVKIEEVLEEEVKKRARPKGPTAAWTSLSKHDQDQWEKRAKAAWKKIVASVKGTELEQVVKGKSFKFAPKEVMEKGWYAMEEGGTLKVGMAWVKSVEANPRNEWDNLAHELGGHYEYGRTYASEIMIEFLELMPKAEREKWKKSKKNQEFYEAFQYAETEIFASLRQLKYREPLSGPKPKAGGIHPYRNIPDFLLKMKDAFHPEVAKAVLKELKRRIDKSPKILARDKKYYVDQVKKIFKYTL